MECADDWEQLEILCAWDEQMEYERIRPLVLFGDPVPERATETGTSERTLYRRIAGFELGGMRSLLIRGKRSRLLTSWCGSGRDPRIHEKGYWRLLRGHPRKVTYTTR